MGTIIAGLICIGIAIFFTWGFIWCFKETWNTPPNEEFLKKLGKKEN